MPLSPVANGQAGVPANVNQFIDLLTGVMTDQLLKLLNMLTLKARGAAPGAPTATVGAGGSVDIGAHTYYITFVDVAGGETALSAGVGATTSTGNQTVNLSAIALGPTGTASRRVYRTKLTGGVYLVTTIANNTATTYADTATDASLTTAAATDVYHGSFGGLAVQDAGGTRQAAIMTDGSVLASALYDATGNPGHVAVYDNSGTNVIRTPRIYLGTVDPATYTTVNEGDIWLKG